MELKESLVQSNTSMANEISMIQANINSNLSKLIDDVAKIVGFNVTDNEDAIPSEFVTITLFPPIVLTLQLIESSTTSVMNLINILAGVKSLKIDPMKLLQKYVPYIDWSHLKESGDILHTKTIIKDGGDAEDGI